MKKFDVTALGEILIDFTLIGKGESGKNIFEENYGGAPANCACCSSKLGARTAFIGKTGNDFFGDSLRDALEKSGVYTGCLKRTSEQHTTLAFVTLDDNGERHFSFCRNPGADTQLSKSDLDINILQNTKILHIGSLSLTTEPAKSATLEAIKIVKNSGGIISYDPNWREQLWPDKEKAISEIKSLFKYADIVKVSLEELRLLFGSDCSMNAAVKKIEENGPELVLVTLGPDGVYYDYNSRFSGVVGCKPVTVIDTTGAGDSFNGGLLYSLTRKDDIFNFSHEELVKDLEFANAVASICVTRRGAIPALPELSEVYDFMK